MTTAPTDARCPGCFELSGKLRQCQHCGYDQDKERSALYLPHHYLLSGQYLIGRVLGQPGGFGITYLAWDINLQRKVAIKEYLPKQLATRAENAVDVRVRREEHQNQFDFGRDAFLAEARTVARFDHPSIVRVRNFFRAHETAYMVMDYHEGRSLADHLERHQRRLPVETALGIMRPILDGLRLIHDQGYLHRDLKPDNIYLSANGKALLLDFGAARQAASAHNQDAEVVLTDGYAPLEQYQRDGNQGPWTDVYAAAASFYRLICGQAIPSALDRVGAQELDWPQDLNCPDSLKTVLQQALSVNAEARTATASEFVEALNQAALHDRGPQAAPEQRNKASERPKTRRNSSQIDRKSHALAASVLLLSAALVIQSFRSWPPSASALTAEKAPISSEAIDRPAGPNYSLPRMQAISAPNRPAFNIANQAITVLQFAEFIQHSRYDNPAWDQSRCENPHGSNLANWQAPGRIQSLTDPVACLSLADVNAYIHWLNQVQSRQFRLPTTDELAASANKILTLEIWKEWTCSFESEHYCSIETQTRQLFPQGQASADTLDALRSFRLVEPL